MEPNGWSVDRVGEWLDEEGYGSMKARFRSEIIDGFELLSLTDEKLKDLGLPSSRSRSFMEKLNSLNDQFASFTPISPLAGPVQTREKQSSPAKSSLPVLNGTLQANIYLCPYHGERYQAVCVDCEQEICPHCLSPRHSNHIVQPLENYFQLMKTRIPTESDHLKESIAQVAQFLPPLNEHENLIQNNLVAAEEKIEALFTSIHQKIDEHKAHALAQVRTICGSSLHYVAQAKRECRDMMLEIDNRLKLLRTIQTSSDEPISLISIYKEFHQLPPLVEVSCSKFPLQPVASVSVSLSTLSKINSMLSSSVKIIEELPFDKCGNVLFLFNLLQVHVHDIYIMGECLKRLNQFTSSFESPDSFEINCSILEECANFPLLKEFLEVHTNNYDLLNDACSLISNLCSAFPETMPAKLREAHVLDALLSIASTMTPPIQHPSFLQQIQNTLSLLQDH